MGRDSKYCNKKTIKIKEKKSIRTKGRVIK